MPSTWLDKEMRLRYECSQSPVVPMFKATFLMLAMVFVLCGCKTHMGFRFHRGQGDVAQIILLESIQRGGTPSNTNSLPVLAGKWHYSKDEYAIAMLLPREHYETVRDMVNQWYGQPRLGPTETLDDGWLSVYRFTPKGGAMQVGCDQEVTFVNIIRPIKDWEETAKILGEVARDKRYRRAMKKLEAADK
jgi:hypothetical protein